MCLDGAGGMLLYRPEKVCQIVLAFSMHNCAIVMLCYLFLTDNTPSLKLWLQDAYEHLQLIQRL